MGKCEDEKVMTERNRMGLVQALTVLHNLRDISGDDYIVEAFNVVFEWIDNVVILLKRFGGIYHD